MPGWWSLGWGRLHSPQPGGTHPPPKPPASAENVGSRRSCSWRHLPLPACWRARPGGGAGSAPPPRRLPPCLQAAPGPSAPSSLPLLPAYPARDCNANPLPAARVWGTRPPPPQLGGGGGHRRLLWGPRSEARWRPCVWTRHAGSVPLRPQPRAAVPCLAEG